MGHPSRIDFEEVSKVGIHDQNPKRRRCDREGRPMRLVKLTIAVALGALCWTLPASARECVVDAASFQADFEA